MFNTSLILYIPRLKFSHKDHKGAVFTLDWEKVQRLKNANYKNFLEHWVNTASEDSENYKTAKLQLGLIKADQNRVYQAALPPSLRCLENKHYLIPNHYKDEIHHFACLALSEDNRHRRMDTSIRDRCLDVKQSAINTIFMLLADCLYDPNVHEWMRSNRGVYEKLLRYNFWHEYTGSGLVWDKSGLREYEDPLFKGTFAEETIAKLREWRDLEDQKKFVPSVSEGNIGFPRIDENGEEIRGQF